VVNLFWCIQLFLWFRFQFPPAPTSSSIPEWQLLKNTKSQVEQQDKISNSDVPNSSQTSEKNILNETQKTPEDGFQLNGLIGSDNETSLPTSSNQNLIVPKDMDNENDSEHIENNEGLNKWREMYECEKYIFSTYFQF